MRDLLMFIRSFTGFSEESWDALRAIITKIKFRKGDDLVGAGKVCRSLYFISQGYCRAFYVHNGVEVNTAFYFENEIATNINSYLTESSSSFAIRACEPVLAYRFDKNKVLQASKLFSEIGIAGKHSLQLIAAKQEKQLEMFRLLSAKHRYEYLEENQPELLQRVSLTQLSSYLGVARETLSRIRNKRTQK